MLSIFKKARFQFLQGWTNSEVSLSELFCEIEALHPHSLASQLMLQKVCKNSVGPRPD